MEKAGQIAMMANTEVLKEPRGFIKFIQIIIAIFAFATTTAYYGSTSFALICGNETTPGETKFSYSFNLRGGWDGQLSCFGNETWTMFGDFSPPSQFYVFVGVMAFLYSLAAVILYVFFDDKYRQMDSIPAADLVITVIFVLLWLIASSAWADGVSKVKHYTSPTSLWADERQITHSEVTVTGDASYASLNVSIIFGFLNMCVWAGNIWFLYKETKWFAGSNEAPPTQQQPGSPENPQQRI